MVLPEDLRGLRVTVMGLGVFGGGAGLTRFLVDRGAQVLVTDLRTEKVLARGLAQIEGLPVQRVLGEHREKDFLETDLVVVNPAVPPDSPFLKMAESRGIPVETEMNLTLALLPSQRVVGITGSNGKTTTSHLVYHLLKGAGEPAWLGGNMGGSLLPEISRIGAKDPVVLELSSFQLERSGEKGLGPAVGVVTNLTPNHLDRHKDFDAYVEAKAQIFVRAESMVLNADDPVSMERFAGLDRCRILFSVQRPLEEGLFIRDDCLIERFNGQEFQLLERRALTLPGLFNAENFLAAVAAARLLRGHRSLPTAAIEAGAAFTGVPHRLELVALKNGVRYINDSISTTPTSCVAGLGALEGDIHLILGGYDKGLPLDELVETVVKRARSVFLVGATGKILNSKIKNHVIQAGENSLYMHEAETLSRAVKEAARTGRPGSTVLLSPGFASYDQFLNFEERGECFRKSVATL